MHLYFKIRNTENLTLEEQKDIIKEQITHRCSFDKYGAELIEFITYNSENNPYTPPHVVAHYYVSPEADFKKIENKIIVFNLHVHFIILACVI